MTWLSQPKLYDHQIQHTGLVEDDALAALLDRYPAELLDINAYSYDAEGQVSLATGERGRADGASLLEAIKGGGSGSTCATPMRRILTFGGMSSPPSTPLRRTSAFVPSR